MSGSVKFYEPWTSGLLLFLRISLAGFLILHCFGQLMAFWQAAQIIGPGAFPVLLTNAAVPLMFFMGAIMLAIGFKTRFAAIAMLVLLTSTTLFALVLSGSLGFGRLNLMERLTVILVLLQPVLLGPGKMSIDAVMAARFAARAAQ
ncbi:MAG: DoxX family protein [Xanthobacteraceae bacterium]|nr:DoxX family protein [Xanthobacteraceae bacterium]